MHRRPTLANAHFAPSIRRVRATSLLLIGLGMAMGFALLAQQPGAMSEEEKKRAFLRAREEMKTIPATPSPEATPKPKPRPMRTTPAPATPTPKPTPKPEPTPKPPPRTTPRPGTPPPVTPKPRPATPEPQAPVVIEKSASRELEPAKPDRSGWFGWGTKFKFLTQKNRNEIDNANVQRQRWRYIVVHNSGTRQGNAKAFDYYHRNVRKMPNGLAYQFVIGNGSSSGDGEIEIGNRWRRQIGGGHVHSDHLNNIALGICLVGDFNRDRPTQKQIDALDELIRYLRNRVGKTEGKVAIVKPHREINPPRWPTDCPGDRFPYGMLHRTYD